MKLLDKLMDYLYISKEGEMLLFDPKGFRIFFIEDEWLKEHNKILVHTIGKEVEMGEISIEDFSLLSNKLISFPKPNDIEIMKDFAMMQKKPDMHKCLYHKGAYGNFKKYLKQYKLIDAYNSFRDKCYKQIINDWAIQYGILEKKISKSEIKKLVNVALDMASFKPWIYFSDLDYFTIHHQGQEISYVILGNHGTCYGVCIYFGREGKNELLIESMLANIDDQSTLTFMLKNSYAIYYDFYDDLTPDDQDFLDPAIKEIEDIMYPQFNCFKIGKPFSHITKKSQFNQVYHALNLLNIFLDKYIEKPRRYNDIFHLDITIDNNYNVTFKKAKPDETPIPSFDLSLLEDKPNFKTNNHTYAFDLIGSPTPVVKDGEGYLPFIPVLLDINTKKIVYAFPIVIEDGDYIAGIYNELKEFFLSERAPKEIICYNPITTLIATLLLKDNNRIIMEDIVHDRIKEFEDGLFEQLCHKNNKEPFVQ